jgi:N-acetylmuramoyl-L-alanine amidase
MKRYFCILMIAAAAYFFLFSAVKFNQSAEVAAVAALPITVIVDAGHGGEDGGAATASGVLESHLNLQIALRMEQFLALCGIEPMMIREDDVSIYTGSCNTLSEKKVSDLKNRVQIVNAVPNGLLVSIHQNHFSQSRYSGAQVFYASTEGSRDLAQEVQNELRIALNNDNHREIKEASSVYLMQHIDCTGILVECGFLSNPEEANLLQKDEYQKKLTCAICGAVSRYLEGSSQNEV